MRSLPVIARRRSYLGLLAVAIMLGGCGGGEGTLTGKVTLDGQPLADGQIAFYPQGDAGEPDSKLIKDGKYSVNLKVGTYQVQLNASKVVGQRPAYEGDPNSPMIPINQPLIPAKFNAESKLTVTIVAGANEKDFAVTSN